MHQEAKNNKIIEEMKGSLRSPMPGLIGTAVFLLDIKFPLPKPPLAFSCLNPPFAAKLSCERQDSTNS
jgi:hypothetical protein